MSEKKPNPDFLLLLAKVLCSLTEWTTHDWDVTFYQKELQKTENKLKSLSSPKTNRLNKSIKDSQAKLAVAEKLKKEHFSDYGLVKDEALNLRFSKMTVKQDDSVAKDDADAAADDDDDDEDNNDEDNNDEDDDDKNEKGCKDDKDDPNDGNDSSDEAYLGTFSEIDPNQTSQVDFVRNSFNAHLDNFLHIVSSVEVENLRIHVDLRLLDQSLDRAAKKAAHQTHGTSLIRPFHALGLRRPLRYDRGTKSYEEWYLPTGSTLNLILLFVEVSELDNTIPFQTNLTLYFPRGYIRVALQKEGPVKSMVHLYDEYNIPNEGAQRTPRNQEAP
jgi:hypothetical protein